MPFARIKELLNRVSIIASSSNRRPVRTPIPQQHRNRCRPATFRSLLDERNVEPNPSIFRRLRLHQHHRKQAQHQTSSKTAHCPLPPRPTRRCPFGGRSVAPTCPSVVGAGLAPPGVNPRAETKKPATARRSK